jgi:hypothetical protein
VGDEDIDCVWLSYDGELFRHAIPSIALMFVDQPAESEEKDVEDEEENNEEDEDDDDEDETHGEKRRAK